MGRVAGELPIGEKAGGISGTRKPPRIYAESGRLGEYCPRKSKRSSRMLQSNKSRKTGLSNTRTRNSDGNYGYRDFSRRKAAGSRNTPYCSERRSKEYWTKKMPSQS